MTSAYTALESLLLFQALRAEGSTTQPFSFNRISDQLKSLPLVRNDPSYNEGRLSPDALRDCYLRLVKEEVKKDRQEQEEKANHVTNGDASPGPRKRKLSSPPSPKVQEAAQWPHLIPQLVERLYKSYRDNTIRELREYERKYDALSRKVGEMEAGSLGERLQEQRTVSATHSPKPSTAAHTQPTVVGVDHAQLSQPTTGGPASPPRPVEASMQAAPKRYSTATIDAVMNHDPEPQYNHGSHRRSSSNTTLPPLSEMAPQSPRFGIPPKLPGPYATQMPHLQQPPLGHGYANSPPAAHQSPYAPQHAHPAPSPQLQNSFSRPSSSPRPILPPPPGMKLPPPTPPQHNGSPSLRGPPLPAQQHYQAQHRSSLAPAPTSDRALHNYPQQLPHPPPPPGYYQQPQYIDRRTPYPSPQGHQPPQVHPTSNYPVQAPHRAGGYQLQPFLLDGSQPATAQQKQHYAQQHQTPRLQPPSARLQRPVPYPQYPNAPATAPQPLPQPQSRLISDIVAALATPPRQHRKPLWKSERRAPPLPLPIAPSAPDIEPLSPTTERIKPVAKRYKSPTRFEAEAPSHQPQQVPSDSPGSIGSSRAGDPTQARKRSRPINDATVSDDRPGSRGNVKLEPSTPAQLLDQPEHAPEPSATPASGPMTRKRRGTLQSQPQPPSKRKRQQSPIIAPEEDAGSVDTPPPRPTTVTATRNFAKMAATIMNDITSHKHASYFAGPVRDKDANGYSEIIKQPQHLKSVRAAITAGTRAIAAATSTLDSPSATPSGSVSKAADGSTTVELERTSDLIPPKAIVNGAQLEKEVYRMFANAVMFNPGEDGLVADTREMFMDVEAKIRDWRGAERDVGVEEEEEGKGKRRKL